MRKSNARNAPSTSTSTPPTKIKELLVTKARLHKQLTAFSKALDNAPNVSTIEARYHESADLLPNFFKIVNDLQELDVKSCKENEYDAFEAEYYEIIGKARAILKSPSMHVPIAATSHSIVEKALERNTHLKKPKLPIFSGSFNKWQSWFQMYKSLIHDV